MFMCPLKIVFITVGWILATKICCSTASIPGILSKPTPMFPQLGMANIKGFAADDKTSIYNGMALDAIAIYLSVQQDILTCDGLVLDYGAVGDGMKENLNAFQKALDLAGQDNGGSGYDHFKHYNLLQQQ